MKLQDFDYELPSELIAQYPLGDRDRARLMVVERSSQKIHHHFFSNIEKFLPPQSLIALNDSKVIPARLIGTREKTGGRVEIFLLNRLPDGYSYEAMVRPLKKLKIGEKIIFPKSSIYAALIDAQKKIVRFNRKDLNRTLGTIGHMPLPPYIKREDTRMDQEYYQTVYANKPGSVAAPTAGLHFTDALLKKLKSKNHQLEMVTLHVNYATFSPVKEEDISRHKMYEEQYFVSSKTLKAIKEAKEKQRKVVAVGTTSCRVLETLATSERGNKTNIFIYPGYNFQLTDILITNFHYPKSTLLMLVYAFGSPELMKKAYQEAISQKYRFYSYGDAMMII